MEKDEHPPRSGRYWNTLKRIGDIVEICTRETAIELLKKEMKSVPIGVVVDLSQTCLEQFDRIKELEDKNRGMKMAYKKARAEIRRIKKQKHRESATKRREGYFSE